MELHLNYMNREDSLIFSQSWISSIHSLQECNWLPVQLTTSVLIRTENSSLIPPLSNSLFPPLLTWWLHHIAQDYVCTDISHPPLFLPSFPPPPYPLFPSSHSSIFEYPHSNHQLGVYSACNSVNVLLNCHFVISDTAEQNFRRGFYLTNQRTPRQNFLVHSVHIQ